MLLFWTRNGSVTSPQRLWSWVRSPRLGQVFLQFGSCFWEKTLSYYRGFGLLFGWITFCFSFTKITQRSVKIQPRYSLGWGVNERIAADVAEKRTHRMRFIKCFGNFYNDSFRYRMVLLLWKQERGHDYVADLSIWFQYYWGKKVRSSLFQPL